MTNGFYQQGTSRVGTGGTTVTRDPMTGALRPSGYDPRQGEWFRSAWDVLSPSGQFMQQYPQIGQYAQQGAAAVREYRAPALGAGGLPISPSAEAVAQAERHANLYDLMTEFGERKGRLLAQARARGIRGPLRMAPVYQAGERFARGTLMPQEIERQRRMMGSRLAEERLRLGEAVQQQEGALAQEASSRQQRMRQMGQEAARMGTEAQMGAWQS